MLTTHDYNTMFNHLPIMIWRTDMAAMVDYFSPAWLELTGRSMNEEREQGWLENVHPDDKTRVHESFLYHFVRREPLELEFRVGCPSQEWCLVRFTGKPFLTALGQFAGYIGSCTEVTAEAVERRPKLLEELAAQDSKSQTVTSRE